MVWYAAGWLCALRRVEIQDRPDVTQSFQGRSCDLARHSVPPPIIHADLCESNQAQQQNIPSRPSSIGGLWQPFAAVTGCQKQFVPDQEVQPDKQMVSTSVPFSLQHLTPMLRAGGGLLDSEPLSSDAQQLGRSTRPARPATALASRSIKHRAASPTLPLDLPACQTLQTECCICSQDLNGNMSIESAVPGHGCCTDCGSNKDPFQLCQHATAGGLSAKVGMSTAGYLPSNYLNRLDSRRRSSHSMSSPLRELHATLQDQWQQADSTANHLVATGRDAVQGDVLQTKSSSRSAITAFPVVQSDMCESAAVQDSQHADTVSLTQISHESHSPQVLISDWQQAESQCTVGNPGQHMRYAQQKHQAEPLHASRSHADATDCSQPEWQLPQAVCDQLQQATLTVTGQLRVQGQATSPTSSVVPALLPGQTAIAAAMQLCLQPCASLGTTPVAMASPVQAASTAAARPQACSGIATVSQKLQQHQASNITAAMAPAEEPTEIPPQLGAVATDSHFGMKPQSSAQSDWLVYPGLISSSLSQAPPKRITCLAGLQQAALASATTVSSEAAPDLASLPDVHALSTSAKPCGDAERGCPRSGTADQCEEIVITTHPTCLNPCSSNRCLEGESHLAAVHKPISSSQPGTLKHRSSPVVTVDMGTATDVLQSDTQRGQQAQVDCSTVWPQEWRMLVGRCGLDRDDAAWVLDESDSNVSDSEGSVSSQSNLRPSSVGRCRVNSGRHSKVGRSLMQILYSMQ